MISAKRFLEIYADKDNFISTKIAEERLTAELLATQLMDDGLSLSEVIEMQDDINQFVEDNA